MKLIRVAPCFIKRGFVRAFEKSRTQCTCLLLPSLDTARSVHIHRRCAL